MAMAGSRVVLFNPFTQHSYRSALALQEAGLLERYLTSFYYKRTSPIWKALALAPPALRHRLEALLARRRFDGLDDSLIEIFPRFTLIDLLTERMSSWKRVFPSARRFNFEGIERWAGHIVEQHRPKAVIAFDIAGLETFRMAKAAGVITVLDQTIGHLACGLKTLAEEGRLQPDFADSLKIDVPPWVPEHALAMARLADWILSPSDYVRSTLLEIGIEPQRIVDLPYGVDTKQFTPVARANDHVFRILFVGQVGQRKGIKYLLEAVKRLASPEIELTLVGPMLGDERALAPYRGLYHHLPFVPRNEIQRCYQDADAFVFPSLHEGSSLAVFEALACGLPVITTPNAGSVVRDGIDGFIVPIRDVEALTQRISRLAGDPNLRAQMAGKARKRALEFTWKRYGEQLVSWLISL